MSPTTAQQPADLGVALSLDSLPSEAGRVRELQPQLLLLCDFAVSSSILAPQREALPFAVAPEWPEPQAENALTAYAETCCLRWFWGQHRVIDPARAFHICGFGTASAMAYAMGQHLSLMGHKPASVIVIDGRNWEVGESAPVSLSTWDRAKYRLWKVLERFHCDGERARWLRDFETVQSAIDRVSSGVAHSSRRLMTGWKRSTGLAPFSLFELAADETIESSGWEDARRCRVRGSRSAIGVWRAAEVNAFLLNVLRSHVEGIQLPELQLKRSASATLERVAQLIAENQERTE
jgi:hypothetical protein